MPRPRTKPEDIKNPEHYFNRYIACEIKHDRKVQQEIEDNEVSLDEKIERSSFAFQVAVNKSDEMLRCIVAKEPDGWIELLENKPLKDALYILTPRQREIVRLYFFEGMKIPEIASVLSLYKSTVSRHLEAAKKNLSIILVGTQLLR